MLHHHQKPVPHEVLELLHAALLIAWVCVLAACGSAPGATEGLPASVTASSDSITSDEPVDSRSVAATEPPVTQSTEPQKKSTSNKIVAGAQPADLKESSTDDSTQMSTWSQKKCELRHTIDLGVGRFSNRGDMIHLETGPHSTLAVVRAGHARVRVAAISHEGELVAEPVDISVPEYLDIRHVAYLGDYFLVMMAAMCPTNYEMCMFSQLVTGAGVPVGELDMKNLHRILWSRTAHRGNDRLFLAHEQSKSGAAVYEISLSGDNRRPAIHWTLLKDMHAELRATWKAPEAVRLRRWVDMYLDKFLVVGGESWWFMLTDVWGYTETAVGGDAAIAYNSGTVSHKPVDGIKGRPLRLAETNGQVALLYETHIGKEKYFALMDREGNPVGQARPVKAGDELPEPWTRFVTGTVENQKGALMLQLRNAAGFKQGNPIFLARQPMNGDTAVSHHHETFFAAWQMVDKRYTENYVSVVQCE